MKEQKARNQSENKQKTGWWNLSGSGWRQLKGIHLKKDQLVIGLLTGVLLIVIAWPVEEKSQRPAGEGVQNRAGTELQEGDQSAKEHAAWNGADGEEEAGGSQSGAGDPYTEEMEERLSRALTQVEGVGKVQVLITRKTSSEKVVEKDIPAESQQVEEEDANGGKRTTSLESREETTVYREAEDGSRSPYVVKEIKPVAEGVLVIAQGGGNPVTAQNILEAVQALFPLDSHKIKIMKMEGSK